MHRTQLPPSSFHNFSLSLAELKVVWADMAPNSALHTKFSSRLVEDNTLGLMSYVDYLCNMHIKIQAKCK